MKITRTESIYHQLFKITIILKGLHALIEIIGGILFFFVTRAQIKQWILYFTSEELIEDPNDLLANFLVHTASRLSISVQQFIGWYLLIHGLVNIIPIYGLLKRQLWAYPTAIAILSFFIIYQLFRFYSTNSVWFIALSVFDGLIIFLILHEYRFAKLFYLG